MNEQEKFKSPIEQGQNLRTLAERARNPYQAQLRELVVFKDQTKEQKQQYKKVKEEFCVMSRWLYAQKYWGEEGNVIGKPEATEEAKKIFWGDKLKNVISKPQPEI